MVKGEKDVAFLESRVAGQANTPISHPAHTLTYVQVIEELGSDPIKWLVKQLRATAFGRARQK
jgi:hypothetical protein